MKSRAVLAALSLLLAVAQVPRATLPPSTPTPGSPWIHYIDPGQSKHGPQDPPLQGFVDDHSQVGAEAGDTVVLVFVGSSDSCVLRIGRRCMLNPLGAVPRCAVRERRRRGGCKGS